MTSGIADKSNKILKRLDTADQVEGQLGRVKRGGKILLPLKGKRDGKILDPLEKECKIFVSSFGAKIGGGIFGSSRPSVSPVVTGRVSRRYLTHESYDILSSLNGN